MKKRSRSVRYTALVTVVLVSGIALGSSSISHSGAPSFNAALTRSVGEGYSEDARLSLGSTKLCDSFDPGQVFDSWCGVIVRMYSRNLLAYAGQPGTDGQKLLPDLAASLPRVSKDKKVWTFRLRKDVLWNDNTQVTSTDIRHTIERLYDPEALGAVSMDTMCLLTTCSKGLPDYRGPYESGHLASVDTPDDFTIIFHLTREYATFANVVALPQFGSVESVKDRAFRRSGDRYSDKPSSNGPFVLTIADDQSSVQLDRNPYWKQSTDPVRSPHVTSMHWVLFETDDALDQALVQGDIDVKLNNGLNQAARIKVMSDKELIKNVDQVETGVVDYLALVATAIPLDRQPCREAIFYALDKADLVKIRGGSDISQITGTMTSSVLSGANIKPNPYSVTELGVGDLNQARKKLVECGYPDGFQIRMAYVTLGLGEQLFLSVQRSLARVGIVVDPVPYVDFTDYFASGVGSPDAVNSNHIALIPSSWSPEGIDAVSYWAPIVDSRKIKPRSNLNYAEYADDSVNLALDALRFGKLKVAKANRLIDSAVMSSAQYLPYARERQVLYRSPALSNVYVQRSLGGQYDLVNLGTTGNSTP
ncbi:MAG: ABC transporter substrate-binding protein [Actinomycetes bacterium]